MCGIAGFSLKPKFESHESENRISRMLNAISHRGPDDSSAYISSDVCIGSVRLSIVATTDGKQPFFSKDKSVVLVFNGEIFNYKQLRSELFEQGVSFNGFSEGEVLLNLYLKIGINFISKIQGQFAIAVYDRRIRKIFLVRDQVGIRPLFYTYKGKDFSFCSEIKGIATQFHQPLEIDFRAIAQTSMYWTTIGQQTAFKNVWQIPPAHYLVWDDGNIKLQRYWLNPIVKQQEKTNVKRSLDNLSEEFIYQLRQAVRGQLQSDVGLSSYISGGIDSSVLALLLAREQDKQIDTFSVQFENQEYDETPFQNAMVKHIGSKHHNICIRNNDIAQSFVRTVHHAEAILFRTAPTPLLLLSKLVRNLGHKVIFTGEGADEVLLGYDLFREAKIRRFWAKNPNSKWRGELLRRLYHYLPQFRDKRFFGLMKDFYLLSLKENPDIFFAHTVRWKQYEGISSFFSTEFRNMYQTDVLNADLLNSLPSGFSNLDMIKQAQIIEFETLLSSYLLCSQGDRMTMANSVEGRYPFLDLSFMEYAAKLPDEVKLKSLSDKHIMRKAFELDLPKEIVWRPKVAYQAPETKSFFDNGKPVPIVCDMLDSLSSSQNFFFDHKKIEGLIKKAANPNTAERMGFRENCTFVIALSSHILQQAARDWCFQRFSDHKLKIRLQK